jgi:hypothetical protein
LLERAHRKHLETYLSANCDAGAVLVEIEVQNFSFIFLHKVYSRKYYLGTKT